LPASSDAPITAYGVGLHDPVHVADDVGVLRAIARRRRVEIHDDAHVGGDRAGLRSEHRIQVHLGDLGKVGDELRHVPDHRRQRLAIHRLRAAHTLQHVGGGNAVEHRQRFVVGCRRQAERDVLQHFDQHAAQTERDELAERGIGHRADDDLLSTAHHLLHLDAEQVGLLVVLLRVGHDLREPGLCLRRVLHADDHAARLRLVQDLRRHDLHHDRVSDLGRELRCLGGRLRHAFLRHGDAVRVANELPFRRRQGRAPRGLHGIEDLPDFLLIGRHRSSLYVLP
jgi:hypothetical protein